MLFPDRTVRLDHFVMLSRQCRIDCAEAGSHALKPSRPSNSPLEQTMNGQYDKTINTPATSPLPTVVDTRNRRRFHAFVKLSLFARAARAWRGVGNVRRGMRR
jgi:hypothetical protein